MNVDASELKELAADLGRVASNVGPFVRKAVEKSALDVKREAQARVGARKHFKQAAGAIDYELKGFQGFGASVVQAEIGYNKAKRAGRLGNLVEFGAPRSVNNLAPGSELQAALASVVEDFTRGLGRAVTDAQKAEGL